MNKLIYIKNLNNINSLPFKIIFLLNQFESKLSCTPSSNPLTNFLYLLLYLT